MFSSTLLEKYKAAILIRKTRKKVAFDPEKRSESHLRRTFLRSFPHLMRGRHWITSGCRTVIYVAILRSTMLQSLAFCCHYPLRSHNLDPSLAEPYLFHFIEENLNLDTLYFVTYTAHTLRSRIRMTVHRKNTLKEISAQRSCVSITLFS
jgi:hypothetical protein